MSVEAAVDILVSMNVHEESYFCLDILNKYFANAAKPDDKYRKIKKTNDIYQVWVQTNNVYFRRRLNAWNGASMIFVMLCKHSSRGRIY